MCKDNSNIKSDIKSYINSLRFSLELKAEKFPYDDFLKNLIKVLDKIYELVRQLDDSKSEKEEILEEIEKIDSDSSFRADLQTYKKAFRYILSRID